jgi:IclR family acetate operon transcriptional repressor
MTSKKAKLKNADRYRVPGLERGLAILELLDQHACGLTIERIAEKTGFPKNGVFRVAMTLWSLGYLTRDEQTKIFMLSRRLLSLGSGLFRQTGLMEAALDVMYDFRDQVKETVLIGTLTDDCGVVLEQVLGLHPFKFMVDPGKSLALNAAAPCKAMAAFLPPAERDALVARAKFKRFNKRTITDKAKYMKELADVRQLGYAVDRAEELDGVWCIAAPVFDRHGHPLASIWVTGPADRVAGSRTAAIARHAKEHAARISRRLGNSYFSESKIVPNEPPPRRRGR